MDQIIQSITQITGDGVLAYAGISIFIGARVYAVLWTLKDSIHRSSSLSLQFMSVLFVIVGTPLI